MRRELQLEKPTQYKVGIHSQVDTYKYVVCLKKTFIFAESLKNQQKESVKKNKQLFSI